MSELYDDFLKKDTYDDYTTEKVNVISNDLLGAYNEKGDYVIPNSIVDELKKVKKYKRSVFKNSVFCSAFVPGKGEMMFEITFQKNTIKELALAELFVLENEYKINGYIQNTIKTCVASYTEKLDDFIEKTYQFFNVKLKQDDDEKSVKEFKVDDIETLAYVNARRNLNNNMARLTKKEYNRIYKEYLTKRLELLKQLNTPYALAILEKFNGEYAKIEKYFLQDKNYKAVSELLDKCIEDVSNVNPLFAAQEQEFKEKSKPVIEEFAKQAAAVANEALPKATKDLNKEDKARNEQLETQVKKGEVAKKSVEEQLESQSIREQVKENTNEIKSIKNEAKIKEVPKPESQNLNTSKVTSGDSPTASAAVDYFRKQHQPEKQVEQQADVNENVDKKGNEAPDLITGRNVLGASSFKQKEETHQSGKNANVIEGPLNPEATNLNKETGWGNIM